MPNVKDEPTLGAGAPRAALRITFFRFTSETLSVARGVTAPSLGSGALLGETQRWKIPGSKGVLFCDITRRIFISLGKQGETLSGNRDRMHERPRTEAACPRPPDHSEPSRTASWPRQTLAGVPPSTESVCRIESGSICPTSQMSHDHGWRVSCCSEHET